jgi:dTDP-4-amino-4,6-dideoxygalactose transaminase
VAHKGETVSKRIFLSPPWLGGQERARVEEAFASGYLAPCGPMVERLEREFAKTVGVPHACAVSSGTAALELLFHELGVARGDRVFCSDLTFVSSISAAVRRGAEAVFIDSDEATWTMDPDLLAEALAQAAAEGRLPKAVVAVDLYGQCCDYGRIGAVCERYEVPLIIDAAEALGACYCDHPVVAMGRVKGNGDHPVVAMGRVKGNGDHPVVAGTQNAERRTQNAEGENGRTLNVQGRTAGQAGWAAVYSFNGNKIITTSGGGMIVSRDAGVIERARKRSQQAREPVVWYEHDELGYNFRMSNILAAIGVGQLEVLDQILARKQRIFEWYREVLEGRVACRFMPEAAYGRCTRWLTVIELLRPPSGRNGEGKREWQPPSGRNGEGKNGHGPGEQVLRVIAALERENIEARPVWKPMHLQPVFRGVRIYGGAVSERLFADGLCLPSGSGLERAEVIRIGEVIGNCLIG